MSIGHVTAWKILWC